MGISIRKTYLLLAILLGSVFSCQQEDITLSGPEGNVRFGGISLEFAPIGTSGNRMEGISPWIHIFPNSAKIVFTNKVTKEEFSLEYNPNDFSVPYTIQLPFGTYEFYSKVEAGIFSDFLPFEAKGEFILNSQSLEISLVGKIDYGLISVKNEFLEEATVSDGNIEANLTICDNGTHFYKYVKGGTSTTLKIIESTFGGTIIKKINVGANVHYNFVLKRGEGTANIIDLSIDPFELVDEEIIIGSSVFFEENGTIKCPQASPGDKGEVNGKTYEAVDRTLLIQRRDEGADLSCVCTSLVTDMSEIFKDQVNFNQNISSWDMTKVKSMRSMFFRAYKFDQPIGNWNVSNVSDMSFLFHSAENFNQGIGNWDVSNVRNMHGLFYSAQSFNQYIGNWEVGSVTNMTRMFSDAFAFNQPIGNWDTGEVREMELMFYDADHFNQQIGDWDVGNVQNMRMMFNSADSFNQPIGDWNVGNVITMQGLFYDARSFNQSIENWDVSKVENMQGLFSIAIKFNRPIGNWDVSNVTNMAFMFADCSEFNQEIENWDVGRVINMDGMFLGTFYFNQPIGSWDVSKVTNMDEMFSGSSSFNQDLSKWCVQNIISQPNIFSVGSPLIQSNKPIWGTCPG